MNAATPAAKAGIEGVGTPQDRTAPVYQGHRPRELAGSVLRTCGVSFLHALAVEAAALEAKVVAGDDSTMPAPPKAAIRDARRCIAEARERSGVAR